MYMTHPDHFAYEVRDRSLRAAEEYELRQALRAADELRRAERKAQRRNRRRRYLRLVLGRTA